MADEIHIFSSAHSYAPVLTGENGKLIDLLTACLVDGYTAQSVASITRSGTTATVTVTGGHGITDGKWVIIAGADQSDYNGRFQATYVSSTVFTVQVANSPTTPATGTITARRASAGWNLEYSGTNKAVYRSPNNASARHCFRIQDDGSSAGGAKEAFVRGYASMSDVDTGSEPFPTDVQQATGLYVPKSTTANNTARGWTLIADDKTFYLIIANGSNTLSFGFGHFNSWKAGDGYNSFIGASTDANSTSASSCSSGVINSGSAHQTSLHKTQKIYCPRSYAQAGTAIAAFTYAGGNGQVSTGVVHGSSGSGLGGGFAGPAGNADGGLYVAPVHVVEFVASGAHVIRGQLPGLVNVLHVYGTLGSATTSTGVVGYDDRTLYHIDVHGTNGSAISTLGQMTFDITGPW